MSNCKYCKKEFIVEIESGVYLADIDGDPGRTLERENAKRYATRQSAENNLVASREYRPFRQAKISKA